MVLSPAVRGITFNKEIRDVGFLRKDEKNVKYLHL